MKNYFYMTILLVLPSTLAGCAYSIKDINVNNINPECVRECSKNYSSCISQGNQVGFKTETLRACKESYQVCIQTCPAE